MQDHPDQSLVLTVAEAAAVLRIRRNLAYRLCASGVIPALRLGRRLVVPRAALDELLCNPVRLQKGVNNG